MVFQAPPSQEKWFNPPLWSWKKRRSDMSLFYIWVGKSRSRDLWIYIVHSYLGIISKNKANLVAWSRHSLALTEMVNLRWDVLQMWNNAPSLNKKSSAHRTLDLTEKRRLEAHSLVFYVRFFCVEVHPNMWGPKWSSSVTKAQINTLVHCLFTRKSGTG